ncbi:MAG: MazG nucleotide pyrophosphohydrolase [candidate division WS6 bacterium 34_10]|jgi:nucleoside 2-deoxyribosyltransferase|uniref:MazG nucleotide pyrophosphohydrolase n=1 Tax=candidate division WS6 bacterium 34_10 TaxID=1641389 RepID=A0A101HJ73_9BACT|nr:MAG: MazG nucleotide pyrophosphohydrolase [candidate division WS6 bacterium 34_10]
MKSVVLCGSKRFKKEMGEFAKNLKDKGIVVYEPNLYRGGKEWDTLSGDYKRYILMGLTHDHFYKIKKADVVFVYNKGGYIGNSTTLEIGYAVACDKPIYAFEEDIEEGCRNVLFTDLIKTPTQLIKRLK